MKIKNNRTIKPSALKFCTDSNGIDRPHGEYFSPQYSICNRCLCNNGQAENCVLLQCEKPNCERYERVPGQCCNYRCSQDFVLTDRSTAAVVASLSIILVVILVAISLVWRQLKRKEKYGNRFEGISSTSTQQETDVDCLIERNSIPNNTRNIQPSNANAIKNPLLCEEEETESSSKVPDKKLNPSSIVKYKKTNLFVALSEKQNNSNVEVVGDPGSSERACVHRCEPPPPYALPPEEVSFV